MIIILILSTVFTDKRVLVWDIYGDIENTKPKQCLNGHHVRNKIRIEELNFLFIYFFKPFSREIYSVQSLILQIVMFYRKLSLIRFVI